MSGIGQLLTKVASLAPADRAVCESLFDIQASEGALVVPDCFRERLAGYFASEGEAEADVLARVARQRVVRVRNRWSGEETLFNDLRASRPGMRGQALAAERERVAQEASRTAARCDFCQPELYTPADVFGRVVREFQDQAGPLRRVVSGSNIAKYDAWSGVIVMASHNPLEFTRAELGATIEAAFEWFGRVAEQDADARYPFFLWNCLYKAGASQFHGHAQVLVTRSAPFARVRSLLQAAEAYEQARGRSYLDDLFAVHCRLGLGADLDAPAGGGAVRVLVSLTPTREKETWVICPGSPAASAAAQEAIFRCLRWWVDELNVTSFNVAMAMPRMDDRGRVPYCIARMTDRGWLSRPMSDVGAMELFGTPIVAGDPFTLTGPMLAKLRDRSL